MPAEALIRDVSDTAIWVAQYRAEETDRPDALFHDPLAKLLVGERGKAIARDFGKAGRYTAWTLVTRTVIIDEYIKEAIAGGVDAVLNLGAGLDSRPYRMELPASLQWVEADFPNIVDYMNKTLAAHTPRCQLQRVAVDLANPEARGRFLAGVLPEAKKVLVLTEGVIPYLTEQQVGELADDLHAHPRFAFWISEYFAPQAYRYIRAASNRRQMVNAPFRFLPADWLGFFAGHGWVKQDLRFSADIAIRFRRRPPPMPWWVRIIIRFISKEKIQQGTRATGFQLLVPRPD
jgi:methyltransferase (TIGR00027 family)